MEYDVLGNSSNTESLYLPRETIILIVGPEFDRAVWASFNDILEKSTPSISSTLSIGCNFPWADECASTSLTKIPYRMNDNNAY